MIEHTDTPEQMLRVSDCARAVRKKTPQFLELCAAHNIPVARLGPRSRRILKSHFHFLLALCEDPSTRPTQFDAGQWDAFQFAPEGQ